MPTPESISPATLLDTQALNLLINSAYRGESSKKGWTTEADLLSGLRTNTDALTKMINEPGSIILKYTGTDETILACVYLKRTGLSLYLGMLTVSPELQGSGIGKKMLLAAETHAKTLNCQTITMTVISVRTELIAWYHRHGYIPNGETLPFPTDPEFGTPKQPLFFIVLQKTLN